MTGIKHIMELLRKLFRHGDKFFDLLEASAVEAENSVRLLARLLKESGKAPPAEDFINVRRKEERITEEIMEELSKTFVTPLEREDIEALAKALGKISTTVGEFGEKHSLSKKYVQGFDFQKQLVIVEQATETVSLMVKQLRAHPSYEQVKEQNDRLLLFEGQADKIKLDLTKELHNDKNDPMMVFILLDLYGILEKIFDLCRDSGNIIFRIVLKYSA